MVSGTPADSSSREYIHAATAACDDLADIVLTAGLSARAPEHELNVWRVQDRLLFEQTFHSSEPLEWIERTVNAYLPETAHELRAIAVLLRAETITASTGPVVRAMLERLGVVHWILDVEHTDGLERGWRAMFNSLVCGKEYRQMVEQLGASRKVQKALATEQRELRARVQQWFQPSVDTNEPKDVTKWTRGGAGYPQFAELAANAIAPTLPLKVRKGLYAAYCGMTHPNIHVLEETIAGLPTGGFQFIHRPEDIDKEIRGAYFALEFGIQAWSRYYSTEAEFNLLVSRLQTLAQRLDAASALLP